MPFAPKNSTKNTLIFLLVVIAFASYFSSSAEAAYTKTDWWCGSRGSNWCDFQNQNYFAVYCDYSNRIEWQWCSSGCNYNIGKCNPKPSLNNIQFPNEIKQTETATIYFSYRNDGGDSKEAYISPSFSNDWEIIDYGSGFPNKKLYPKGYRYL